MNRLLNPGKTSEEGILREYVREAMLLHTQVTNSGLPQPSPTSPAFYEMKPHIFEQDYVTKVLGIDLPLNESYPYSAPLYSQIIKEQKLLEDFFRCSDDQIWLIVEQDMLREQDEEEDESSWSWTSAARLAGDVKTAAAAMKMMATDPDRIEKFVAAAMQVVTEPYEKLKRFFTTLMEKAKEWSKSPVFEKIAEFAEKFWGWISDAVDAVKGMSGWKKALAAGSVVLGVKKAWGKFGDSIEEIMEKLNDFASLMSEDAISESYVHTMGLVTAVYGHNDGELNEKFFGKKKKKKDKFAKMVDDMETEEEKGGSDEEKRKKRAEKKSDAADKQEEKMGKAEDRVDKAEGFLEDPEGAVDQKLEDAENTWWGQLGKEGLSDEQKEEGTGIIQWLKDKFIKGLWKKSKKFFSGLAKRAAAAAATGGVSEYFTALGKAYKGIGKVMKDLRPAFQAAAEPSDIKADMEEQGGEEGFWYQGTDRAGKDGEKKEGKNEALLRRAIREALLRGSWGATGR